MFPSYWLECAYKKYNEIENILNKDLFFDIYCHTSGQQLLINYLKVNKK